MFLKKIFKFFFYKLLNLINKNNQFIISIQKISKKKFLNEDYNESKKNLNIGSGGYSIEGFLDLDFVSERYTKVRTQNFIPYDIRKDKIPFNNNTVDNIFCSHVIEHIEEEYTRIFIKECSRVLKKNGVLRITCPDSRFLYEMLTNDKRFYLQKRYFNWFLSRGVSFDEVDEIDCFIREISTSKLRIFSDKNKFYYDFVKNNLTNYSKIISILSKDNKLDTKNIGNHISSYDFEKIKKISSNFFNRVIQSRFQASVSQDMRSKSFDNTCPEMSMYVDLVK